jgi:hypothetical protein
VRLLIFLLNQSATTVRLFVLCWLRARTGISAQTEARQNASNVIQLRQKKKGTDGVCSFFNEMRCVNENNLMHRSAFQACEASISRPTGHFTNPLADLFHCELLMRQLA